MKQFFKMMFASVLGVFVALGAFILVAVIVLAGVAKGMMGSSDYVPNPNTVFKISLSGDLTDNDNDTNDMLALLMGEEPSASLKALLEAIEKAKGNEQVKGIYLDANGLQTGTANRQALRRALMDFKKSGKFIVAYADTYTQGDYYLCSTADKVFLNPQGMLDVTGLSMQTMFYKGLTEKLGIRFETFKVGTYKGAVEPFLLDKLSDANREQMNSYMTSVWSNIAGGIAESRGLTADAVNRIADEGILFAEQQKTVEYGLVDELKYRDEAEAYVRELAGQSGKKLKTADLGKIRSLQFVKEEKGGLIAVLYAEGTITSEDVPAPFNAIESTITEEAGDELAKLRDNEDVKAVVFRVNSPGGSAYISEQIWHQVAELKKVKPVVVSMGNVAASGGYYISCAASRIVAEPSTLTGSIGIFAQIPTAEAALQKVGITADGVKTNRFADFGELNRSFREDEKALLQASIERGYDLFVTRCADGRGMTKEAIDSVAQGRVWTGEQAVEKGLIDELGGMETAIRSAAALAELTDYRIVNVSASKDFLQDIIEKLWDNLTGSALKSISGIDHGYIKVLNELRTPSGIQARIPYDLKPL
ncbi:Protease 4 [Bacteroidales bacterium Barb4]|nr:Protease 4 [Bacteroidales bacterium Barb4]